MRNKDHSLSDVAVLVTRAHHLYHCHCCFCAASIDMDVYKTWTTPLDTVHGLPLIFRDNSFKMAEGERANVKIPKVLN